MLNRYDYPEKFYVEITTRCNLQCPMCVKYAEGSCIEEGDMAMATFKRLLPPLKQANMLLLNGIGEPLLHPDLPEFIQLARETMPMEATIGFQSNGLLLTDNIAEELLKAGLDTICFSMDDMETPLTHHKKAHSFGAVERAITRFNKIRKDKTTLGLETVLTRDNINQLPELVSWAAHNRVDYIITTHLLLYDQKGEELSLFNPNTASAVSLFEKYTGTAKEKGISFQESFETYRRYAGTRSNTDEKALFSSMQNTAKKDDTPINYPELFAHQHIQKEQLRTVFEVAEKRAERNSIDIFLPPLQALDQRECPFIRDRAVFISAEGNIMPCHFLWHTYNCHVHHQEIHVKKRTMGNVVNSDFTTIWNHPVYKRFIQEAEQVGYAPCWSCPSGPCKDLINNVSYGNDCYGSTVPCGHCQWSLGGFRCL